MSDFEDAKLILTPNAYKAGKAYSVKPFDGSGDFTVVRNTTATTRNSSGNLESVAANVPRLNYPIGGGCPSWLIEPQATNLILRSEGFENSYWAKTNASVTADVITAPDGNLTADKLVENNSLSLHRTFAVISCSSSTTYTASVFVKKSERTRFELKETSLNGCIFDLENGTILSGTDGFIESYGNDWYRCGIKKTTSASKTNFVIQIVLIENLLPDYQGDGTSGIYIWGAQLEQGNLTSYIPTNGAAVTRNADVTTIAPPSGTTEIVETLKDITYYIGGNNLITYSEQIDDSIWVKVNSSIIANDAVSPDGYTNADKLVESSDVSTTTHSTRSSSSAIVTNQIYTYSIFAKGNGRGLELRATRSDGNNFSTVRVDYDLTLGVVDSFSENNAEYVGSSIEDYGNGWYRCILQMKFTDPTNTTMRMEVYTYNESADTISYIGDGTSGVYIWGAQIEQGNLTDYQATRDIVTVPTTYQLPNGEIKKVIMI